jgi:hypothetical protein
MQPEGFTITRQDLTNHDPTQPLPYPVKKWWRATEAEAEEWAEKPTPTSLMIQTN